MSELNKNGDLRGKYPRDKAHRDKMSSIKEGYKPTEETNKKISDKSKWMNKNDKEFIQKCKDTNYKKSNPGKKNGMYGKTRPDLAQWNKDNPLTGDKNPSWRGGKSFEPYGLEFNSNLKGVIRQRDNYVCMFCYIEEPRFNKHSIHHIDYNKKNNNPDNLITLCTSCHGKTNFNRKKWTEYFKNKMESIHGKK